MADRVLLIGMMGAGKTTVGRLLAERLGRKFVDTDAEVEKRSGKSIAQLFADEGEPRFRLLESAALQEALKSADDSVVAVAGGAVIDSTNRELIAKSGRVVWLNASVDTLVERASTGAVRPLLQPDPPSAMYEIDLVRRPIYEELADQVIEVDSLEAEEVVSAIVRELTSTSGS